MNEPARTQWQIPCAFNGFCKETLRNEAANAHNHVKSGGSHGKPFFLTYPHRRKISFTPMTAILRMIRRTVLLCGGKENLHKTACQGYAKAP